MTELLEFDHGSHWLVAGTTRSGKSFFTGYLIEKAVSEKRACLVFDPKNENLNGLNALLDVYPFMITTNDIDNITTIEKTIIEQLKLNHTVIVYPSKTLPSDVFMDFEERIATTVFENLDKEYPVIFILDEAHRHLQMMRETEIFIRIIKMGLGLNKSLVIVSQRLNKMSSDALAECSKLVCFRLNRQLDIDYIGKEKDGLSETIEILNDMEQYNYYSVFYDRHVNKIFIIKPVKRVTEHNG